eukprot:2343208-Pyramimonas_sp.AAC.1
MAEAMKSTLDAHLATLSRAAGAPGGFATGAGAEPLLSAPKASPQPEAEEGDDKVFRRSECGWLASILGPEHKVPSPPARAAIHKVLMKAQENDKVVTGNINKTLKSHYPRKKFPDQKSRAHAIIAAILGEPL